MQNEEEQEEKIIYISVSHTHIIYSLERLYNDDNISNMNKILQLYTLYTLTILNNNKLMRDSHINDK